MSLSRRVIQGGLWFGGLSWAGFFASFGSRIVLVRILSPEDFGVFALALSIVGILFLFFGFSFPMAAINLHDEDDVFDTAMWFSIIAGIMVAFLGACLGVLFFNFYKPIIAYIVAILSIIQILRYCAAIFSAYEEKDISYKKISLIKAVARPLAFLIAIFFAVFFSVGIWALVIVEVVSAIFLFFGQKKVSRFRFRGRFNKETGVKIFKFSYMLFFNRMLEVGHSRIPILLIGLLLGTTFLGFFEQAYYLIQLPNTLIMSILSNLNFTVFSKVRQNAEQLHKALSMSAFFVVRFMMPAVILFFLFPSDIVKIFFGAKWVPVAPLLQKFSFFLLFYPVFNLIKSFNYATRKLKAMLFGFAIVNVFLYILIALCIDIGLSSYLPYCFVISILMALIYLLWELSREGINLGLKTNFLCPMLFASFSIFMSYYIPSATHIFIKGACVLGVYIGLVYLKDRVEIARIFSIVMNR